MSAQEISEQIRAARPRAGLTQAAVARRLGVNYRMVQRYEHGKIPASRQRLLVIAKMLASPELKKFVRISRRSEVR